MFGLDSLLDDGEPPSTEVSFDPSFREVVPGTRVRGEIRRRSGVEVGFDLGDEAFMAMACLAVLALGPAGVSQRLVERLAAKARRCEQGGRYRCFVDVTEFPADTDSTATAAGALYEHGLLTDAALLVSARELLRAAAPRGRPEVRPDTVMVYWDDGSAAASARGLKQDPVVCANALYTVALARPLLAPAEGAGVVAATEAYVHDHLTSGRYLEGTRYYPDPAAFLYALARLCARFPAHTIRLGEPLREALANGPCAADRPWHALHLSLLVTAADLAGAPSGQDRRRAALAGLRRADGSWPPGPYYRMGRFTVYFGSRLFTTLMAVRALRGPA
ncbi:hypothetical protein [Streptomyces sp. NPDC088196]|uniref:hypothetical protein n=1 Tax=Streptomyces sp. NPDC088196 TaxID=3154868 RepID=UPI00344D72A1